VNDVVEPMVMTSFEASKKIHKPVELIFIDGAHEYEFAKLDLQSWYPKIIYGGWICFHDSYSEGVFPLLREFILNSASFRIKGSYGTILYGQKKRKISVIDHYWNFFFLFFKHLTVHIFAPYKK